GQQRRHLAMAPCWPVLRLRHRVDLDRILRRRRPRSLHRLAAARSSLPTPPGPFRCLDQRAEPRGRDTTLDTDHLEVLEGPRRCSALFFHTRICTWASPRAALS